jgi:RNA polymerase sigma-70 factor (ECF subfamily)
LATEEIERVARESYGKLIAFLASRTHDVAGAEDALSEAFAAALLDWPKHGVPQNPEGWLLTVARRRQIDAARRRQTAESAANEVRYIADMSTSYGEDGERIPDERLALMFACAHPAIDPAIRAPLMLQTVLGFDAATIASAFLVSPSTMGQRLVRAKNKIKNAAIPFRVPGRDEMQERLVPVLDAIYATYAEGWMSSLAEEAVWLGRVVASLLPDEPEALGLLSLMLHVHARRHARRSARGDYVPLAEQPPQQWDSAMIDEADDLLRQASRKGSIHRYQLEAAVQSAHAVRRHGGTADWLAIAELYDALLALTGSPVVAVNRAAAIAESQGAAAGLRLLEELQGDERLAQYQPYWAARAELLARSGQRDAAGVAYDLAIGLARDESVRAFLQRRRSEVMNTNA